MEELVLTKEDGVGILRINRADKLNAMTTEMWDGFRALLAEIRDDDDIKVMVLTGTGRAFCAGSDVVKRLAARIDAERSRQELLEQTGYNGLVLHGITKPIIGAINGTAAGAGLSLALLCDIRIASDQARFASSWVKRGLIPDLGATWLLPRIVGMDNALELMLTGDMIDAAEALRIGMVTRVVPNDDLMTVSLALAKKIAQGPTIAQNFIKRGAYRSLYNTLDEQLDFESYGQGVCRNTEDHKEGVASFMEKRPAVYRGR
ncbi:MAG: enoyl-CoA hydratase [Dehalococcoidia bacterium]|nr:enoyl-CoA hydratase [Dehalococcoidia bacterium]